MKNNKMPDSYIGREQAYVKHTILETYIQRLFMIVGQQKETVINYVDCFAGPWQENDEKLSDTSIGISLEQMSSCQKALQERFKKNIKFRALYIEKDTDAYGKLADFLSHKPFPTIETKSLHGDYTELLPEIIDWCSNSFTFFFIDPKGWKDVVDPKTMSLMFKLPRTEFLVNLMYDFVNRTINHERHEDDMLNLFGTVPKFTTETPEQRQEILLKLYRKNLKHHYNGRTTYVKIEKPGHDRTHYCLVYLTRSAKGIDVFKAESEKMEIVQRISQNEYKFRKQVEKSRMDDLFGNNTEANLPGEKISDNKYEAKAYLLKKLSKVPTLIDNDKWADFLEDSDLYPSDFQLAMKELLKENRVKNLDKDVSKRRKNFIKPTWPSKSERWVLN